MNNQPVDTQDLLSLDTVISGLVSRITSRPISADQKGECEDALALVAKVAAYAEEGTLVSDICASVTKYRRCSEKQAYHIANFAVNNFWMWVNHNGSLMMEEITEEVTA